MKDKRITERKKERKKGRYNPITANAAPEPQTLSPLPPATSFGPQLPNLGGRHEVHHHLFALVCAKQLRDLRVSASAHFPSCGLSDCLLELCLQVFPLAAVAEEVLPGLGHCPSTPPEFVVCLVAEPF